MIPKTIHYTWFSGDPIPSRVQNCIDSWSKYLPGYKLRLWNMEAVKDIDSVFLQEALATRKWAFAADFIRLWAVYNEGGIYLDTDVLVYKSFDKFLHHRAFIGKERYFYYSEGKIHLALGSHCFGAEKGHPFIKLCLDYYGGRHFITSHDENLPIPLRYNQIIMPYIQAEIARKYGFDWNARKNEEEQLCDAGLMVYPSEYFDNANWAKKTPISVCAHLTLGSWQEHTANKQENIPLKEKIFWRFILPHLRKCLKKLGYIILRCD